MPWRVTIPSECLLELLWCVFTWVLLHPSTRPPLSDPPRIFEHLESCDIFLWEGWWWRWWLWRWWWWPWLLVLLFEWIWDGGVPGVMLLRLWLECGEFDILCCDVFIDGDWVSPDGDVLVLLPLSSTIETCLRDDLRLMAVFVELGEFVTSEPDELWKNKGLKNIDNIWNKICPSAVFWRHFKIKWIVLVTL